ncbi:amidohydrolase family protein [Brevundimonas staleyi]
MHNIVRRLSAVLILSTALAGVAVAQDGEGSQVQVRTDHHMHVHSPAILGFLPGYCASPGRQGPCDPAFIGPLTVDDLLKDMDAAGIRRGWLMSTAYLAHSPMMVPPAPDAHEIMMSANDFTVDLARAHPDRISTFIGINPIADDALGEIARWKGDPAVTGIKLHLTNSDVDLRSPEQVAKLAAVFAAAADADLAIMIHMRTRAPDYGASDVAVFLSEILPHASGVSVVIAHSGGWGGTNAFTLSALEGFATAIEHDPTIRRNLFFDLAQVFDETTSAADLQALATLMRRIGVDAFVPGSDWPFSGDLATYYAEIYPRLPLTEAEWTTIRSHEVIHRSIGAM